MKKDRFVAFFDAIMAIIMIIGITVYPAAVAISVFVAGIMLLINFLLMRKKNQ